MTTSPLVPGLFPVALDGVPFLVDTTADNGGFISQSVPLLRGQADQGARPGEQSLNPEDLWTRSVQSWHHGAGQSHADRPDSDEFRVRKSLHLNPWTKYELTKLNATAATELSGAGSHDPGLFLAGERLWVTAADLKYADTMPSNGLPTLTAATGLPAGTSVWSAAADGIYVYTVHFSDMTKVYRTNAETAVGALLFTHSGAVDLIRFAKDRLLLFETSGAVYDASTGTPALLFTHRLGTNFTWTDATGGLAFIYMGGNAGSTGDDVQGTIYRTAVTDDGSALAAPVVAATLPEGESVLALRGYEDLMLVGTNKGVRVCAERSDGSLEVGALIETGPCRCFEPQGSEVWFGWEDFGLADVGGAANRGGLGRIELNGFAFTDGAPPYATDIAVPVLTGFTTVDAAVTFGGKRLFLASGFLLGETSTAEDIGFLYSGFFNYSLNRPKTFHYLTVDSRDIVARVSISELAPSDPAPALLSPTSLGYLSDLPDGTASINPTTFDLTGWRGNQLEYELRVYGDTPIRGVTLMARPAVQTRSEKVQVSLLVPQGDVRVDGQRRHFDSATTVQHIRDLVRSGAPVDFQDGTDTYPVIVEDYTYARMSGSNDKIGRWDGLIVVTLKRTDTVSAIFRAASTATSTGTLTVPVPDGVIPGDVLYAAVAWTGGTATASAGWNLLREADGTEFKIASYWTNGQATDLVVTFSVAPTAAGAIVAYSHGTTITNLASVPEDAPPTSEDRMPVVVDSQDALAMLSATVFDANSIDPDTSFTGGFAGPLRRRARVANSTVGLEIGDAVSSSTYHGADPDHVTDHLQTTVPFFEEVLTLIEQLT